MSPRSLEVRPTYRRRRLWPWAAGAVLLLALGLWELRAHRRAAATAERESGPAPAARALARPAAIVGSVLGADGRAASAVTVVAAPGGVEARTGVDGRFRLEVEEGSTVRLEAHHSDLGWATAEVRAPAADVQLRLQPRAGLDVLVLAQGAPVAGAVVTVRQRGGEPVEFHADRATDAQGKMRFLGLPGGPLEVEALSPETGARNTLQLDTREGTISPVRLYLPAVGVVQGIVVTRGGAPVAGAMVGVDEAEGLPATSGKDGSFVLKGLRPGRDYRLTSRTADLMMDTAVTARAGQTGVRLVLRDRPIYRGRVVGPGGTPLPAFSIDGRQLAATDGRFAVPLDPRDGRIEIRVGAEGMQTRAVQSGASLSELGDIELQPAPELRGRVKLPSGQPAEDAEVSVGAEKTRTDRAGGFVLPIREAPPEGSALRVQAMKGDLAASAEASLPGSVELVLAGEQAVRIRVLGPSGAPAAGRTVQLSGARSHSWTTGEDGTVNGKALAGEYRVSTDAQPGRVWFVRLPGPEVVLGPASGSASLEVDVVAPLEALWIEPGVAQPPTSSERPGPRTEGQLLFGVDRSARFDGLTPGTWTVVGVRQGAPVLRTVQVSGSTRLSL